MSAIMKDNHEYANTDIGTQANDMYWQDYLALPESQKMNGDLYFIPDKQPEGNPSRIWAKLGTEPLDTQAEDVSGAVNELNSIKVNKTSFTATTSTSGLIQGATEALFGVANAIILSAYLERGSYNARRTIDLEMYGNAGYGFLCKNNGTAINAQSVTITVTYVVI